MAPDLIRETDEWIATIPEELAKISKVQIYNHSEVFGIMKIDRDGTIFYSDTNRIRPYLNGKYCEYANIRPELAATMREFIDRVYPIQMPYDYKFAKENKIEVGASFIPIDSTDGRVLKDFKSVLGFMRLGPIYLTGLRKEEYWIITDMCTKNVEISEEDFYSYIK